MERLRNQDWGLYKVPRKNDKGETLLHRGVNLYDLLVVQRATKKKLLSNCVADCRPLFAKSHQLFTAIMSVREQNPDSIETSLSMEASSVRMLSSRAKN